MRWFTVSMRKCVYLDDQLVHQLHIEYIWKCKYKYSTSTSRSLFRYSHLYLYSTCHKRWRATYTWVNIYSGSVQNLQMGGLEIFPNRPLKLKRSPSGASKGGTAFAGGTRILMLPKWVKITFFACLKGFLIVLQSISPWIIPFLIFNIFVNTVHKSF